MGVCTNCYLVYGVEISGTPIEILYVDGTKPDNSLKHYIYESVLDKYNAICVTEPYSGDWTILGIELFSGNKREFIENIQTCEEKFNQLLSETGINLDELKLFGDGHARFIMDSYFD